MLSDETEPVEVVPEPTVPPATAVPALAPTCPGCGAAVEPEWRHCGACGTTLSGAAGSGAAAAGRSRFRQLFVVENPVLFLGALIVVLLLAAGAAIVSERRLDDKKEELAATERALRDNETVLAAVRGELAERVKERDALRADLDKTKSSLNDAERSVRAQGDQLETFKKCLTAIEDFGLALDRGDSNAARDAGERADRFCTEALALL